MFKWLWQVVLGRRLALHAKIVDAAKRNVTVNSLADYVWSLEWNVFLKKTDLNEDLKRVN